MLYSVSGVVKVAMADMGEAMKDAVLRFWAVEHMLSMIVGIIIITLGRIMAKKAKTDSTKFRRQAIYFTLAMVIIFAAIPWPWAEMGIARPWY